MRIPEGRVAYLEDGTALCQDCLHDYAREHPLDDGSPLEGFAVLPCDHHGWTADLIAERLNDAWAVLRTVNHLQGQDALDRHEREHTSTGGLADDLLTFARAIRAMDDFVIET